MFRISQFSFPTLLSLLATPRSFCSKWILPQRKVLSFQSPVFLSFFLFHLQFHIFAISLKKNIGAIKNYHWGKIGKDSQVLQLFANQQKWANCLSSFSSQSPPFDNEPCAELWLTTHPSGPASVIRHNSALQVRFLSPQFFSISFPFPFPFPFPFLSFFLLTLD